MCVGTQAKCDKLLMRFIEEFGAKCGHRVARKAMYERCREENMANLKEELEIEELDNDGRPKTLLQKFVDSIRYGDGEQLPLTHRVKQRVLAGFDRWGKHIDTIEEIATKVPVWQYHQIVTACC